MHRFRATILKNSTVANAWSFVIVPDAIAKALDGVPRVKGTIAGAEYDAALQSRNGVKRLLVKRELRDAMNLTIGQEVDVTIETDARERTIDVPDELTAALAQRPDIAAAFSALAPSHRREYADWIAQAKKLETKAARVERAIKMISEKQRLK